MPDTRTQEMIVKRYNEGYNIVTLAFNFQCKVSEVFRILRANGKRV